MAVQSDYPGTPLSDAQLRQVLTVETPPLLRYAWDTGVAVGRFLQELKNGRLIARKCRRCRRILVPPRIFCEECFRRTDEWVYVSDRGRVNTYSVSHIRWDASPLKEPVIVAVIEIDGASPGMGILHYLAEIKPEDVRIGMAVEAVWKPAGERTGSILDIRYFRPGPEA
ncbi:MAG: Zn-ribbon domain-containing OB-fold protein [Chloroflexi bacterium]|nr:Zn-ribbon domain-containing OB-fold protein [Chloroflexota bacterium]